MDRSLWLRFSLVLTLSVGGCVTGGGKAFKEAERLRADGQLRDAERAYQEALIAEPKNAKYEDRLSSLRAQIDQEVERLASEGKAKQKANDWSGAADRYAAALALKPDDSDLKARRALSAGKAKNLDPDAWYQDVLRISQEVPNNKLVEKSLAGARANAYQYQLTMGTKMLEAGDGPGALKCFDRAKEIDPATPAFDPAKYDEARALDLLAQADLRLLAGDTVEAYDLLAKAFEIRPLPAIKKKLGEAKARSSAILKKLEAARAKAAQGRHAEALRLYDELGAMKGAPAAASEEASKVRADLARAGATEAERAAERGDLKRARSSLGDAMRYGELSSTGSEALKRALDQALGGQPGKASSTAEGAGLPADSPIMKAARAFFRASAREVLTRAQQAAKKDAAEAMVLLTEIDPFEAELPQIAVLRQSLRKDAFASLLDDALRAAKAGRGGEAAERLTAALHASKAPAALAALAGDGAKALASGRYADAERAFQQALAQAPRSQLAQRGVDVARLLRRSGERDALEVLKTGRGDRANAVGVLAAALAAEPGNASAKEGAELIAARLTGKQVKLSDAELAEEIGQLARLSEISAPAREAIERGRSALAKAAYADAEAAFKDAQAASPKAAITGALRSVLRDRMLSELKSGAKGVAQGDEGSARALAKLLKADPNDAEAQQALRSLLDRAEQAGKNGEDAEAARFLALVVVATEPAPGVKAALDGGNKALGQGNMSEAEKRYADALDLEADNEAAKLGLSLAKGARVASLKEAVSKAKEGQGAAEAEAALKKTLELDPSSAEARQAFQELLDAAKGRAQEGKDREAASLLDTANTVSKPETAKKAIAAANQQLAEGRFVDAEAAYAKILAGGESQLASTGRQIAHDRRLQVLLAGVDELKKGGDLERGAKATAELLKIDATSPDARAAIDAALGRAEQAAAGGDDKAAARELRAADVAAGPTSGLQKAIGALEHGKFDEAQASFAKLSGEVARRGAEIARGRKMGTLKATMSGGDQQAAQSIREILEADPENKEAKAAFQKLLERAQKSAQRGDDRDAAAALEAGVIASGASEALSSTLKVGITHLAEGRHAEAEIGFNTALEVARDSKVGQVGLQLARDRRKVAEKNAVEQINKGGDPQAPAAVLKGTLIVEPGSRVVIDAHGKLLARAKKSAAKGDVADAARSLDAAVELEGLAPELLAKIHEANAALAASHFDECAGLYAAALEGDLEGSKRSEAAASGRAIAQERRLAQLRGELTQAQKEKDTLRASSVAQQILALDPKDRQAQSLAKKLGGDVVGERIRAAEAQRGFGKLGVAHLYLQRALALEPENKQAKSALEKIESDLKESMDLIAVVSDPRRGKAAPASACKGIEQALREELMSAASTREDLGFWTLGKDYTVSWEKAAADAPKVNGALDVEISSCKNTAATGKIGLSVQLVTPVKGSVIAQAKVDAELAAGIVPRDEQDAAGNNARKALAKRAAQAVLAQIEALRGEIDAWPLALAEHSMKKKDVAATAEAWARLQIGGHRFDEKRAAVVQKYLDAELK
ncbi:MAG: hypothetical protein IT384_30530 [Deltaproteobacteria bacterium]|nr:hypothetical protein [Deltaproteobacteria bacterium]